MEAPYHGLPHPFKGPKQVAIGLTDRKNVMVKCLFLVGPENTLVFECPHTQKSEGLGSSETGGCTSNNNCWRTYIDMDIFPCYGVGISLMKFV
jgi:hypothetical protein